MLKLTTTVHEEAALTKKLLAEIELKQGIHPKIVQERLGHASIQMTLDTYSHVAPGLQEAAAESFDKLLNGRRENVAVENHY